MVGYTLLLHGSSRTLEGNVVDYDLRGYASLVLFYGCGKWFVFIFKKKLYVCYVQ